MGPARLHDPSMGGVSARDPKTRTVIPFHLFRVEGVDRGVAFGPDPATVVTVRRISGPLRVRFLPGNVPVASTESAGRAGLWRRGFSFCAARCRAGMTPDTWAGVAIRTPSPETPAAGWRHSRRSARNRTGSGRSTGVSRYRSRSIQVGRRSPEDGAVDARRAGSDKQDARREDEERHLGCHLVKLVGREREG